MYEVLHFFDILQQTGFSKSQKSPPSTILKTLRFLSLGYAADFRRSRLVFFFRQTTILTLIGPLFLQQKLLKLLRPKAKSGQRKLSAKGPPIFFHFFNVFYKTGRD